MHIRSPLMLLLAAASAACFDGAAQDSPAPPTADYSSAIALRDAGECRFDTITEHAFEGLLLIGQDPDGVTSAPVVAVGTDRLTPQLERVAREGVPDGFEYRAEVTLPAGSTWHGLPIERLWVEFVAPPETDSLYRRGIAFAATADQVRDTLAAQGAEVPVRPKYRELGEFSAFAGGTCGGAIMIEQDSRGASLVCDRGC